MNWWSAVVSTFYFFERTIILYVAAINSIYFLLMVLGFFALRQYREGLRPEERSILLNSPMLPEVDILVPAYNEAKTIVESVKALLNLHYANHHVIVINDGSKDETLQILIEQFHLCRSARRPDGELPTRPIRAVYRSRSPIRLTVIDKENGGKADALNAGLNVARGTLVAAVDSDSLLEPDALSNVIEPFVQYPGSVIACGGIIRVVNGCSVEHGRVTRIATPGAILPLFQTVEYLRAFLGGRLAFSFLNCLLLISGAFGVFRRDALVEAGGFLITTVGEDMELVVRLHKRWRRKAAGYNIFFVPEPVCWTEVPESWRVLHQQRNRWQRGTVETLAAHRDMFFRPRFGAPGLFAIPYFAFFEMLGPAVELAGYLVTGVGLALRLISVEIALSFFVVSILFGILLSMSAVVLEEFTMRRYPSIADLGRLLGAAVLENFGYRQVLAIWRVQGVWDAFRGKAGWGTMERRGFKRRAATA
jgi:cellulose synthase/poly-beta-1,6-N-acetylglucosamine synthase-like glycosyltransferase